MQAQAFHYQRQYQDGEKYGYKLSATTTVNGNFRCKETGISSHVVSGAGTPVEEVSWISLRTKTPGIPNNFQMLKRNPDRKLSAFWGKERYTVITKMNRSSGRIMSATMENDLTLKMRKGCDVELNSCEAELPVVMHRDLLLESVETGTPNQSVPADPQKARAAEPGTVGLLTDQRIPLC
jgi:hypothetical protein